MRLKSKVIKVSLVLCVLGGLAIALVLWYGGSPEGKGSSGVDIFLAKPAFAQEVDTAAFPEDEAGISAYVNVGQNIDLEQAKTAFIGLIDEGSDYVIGTVSLEGLPEETYPHVYISQSAWILAYYTKNSPSSLIMQWHDYKGGPITTTTLRDAIFNTSVAIRVDFSKIEGKLGYYHFQYPEATKMLLVADLGDRDSFTYMIPLNVVLFEASWWSSSGSFALDNRGKTGRFGKCEDADIVPGAVHTAKVYGGGGIIFIYK